MMIFKTIKPVGIPFNGGYVDLPVGTLVYDGSWMEFDVVMNQLAIAIREPLEYTKFRVPDNCCEPYMGVL